MKTEQRPSREVLAEMVRKGALRLGDRALMMEDGGMIGTRALCDFTIQMVPPDMDVEYWRWSQNDGEFVRDERYEMTMYGIRLRKFGG